MKVIELVTCEVSKVAEEARGRADAEAGRYVPPVIDSGGTYQLQMLQGALWHAYSVAHSKRMARLARMKDKAA